ncbi:MAG: iron ABC transporter permease [Marinobacter sp.]|uniref:FecCD family ABC transporter permease n=1 Tax=Marinobacter sp. TaxID=50741 RepID=UPI00299F1ABD|nr:iron ABC transporter permease [Marinobacter sp.]MDX1635429.1 iron ABC transporter permease [Marinobacter sp.]
MKADLLLRASDDRWSVRLAPGVLAVSLVLFMLLLASGGLYLSLGSHPTTAAQVLAGLTGKADPGLHLILFEIRLPRLLMAILVGAALAVSGLVLQGLVRNPLASPDVIGITGGASAAAVTALWLGSVGTAAIALVPAALAGAALVALLMVYLAWQQGVSPSRLVLIGIGLAAGLGALTTLLLVLSPDATAMMAYVWLTGSLYGSRWQDVVGLLPWVLVCLPLVMARGRHLDIQSMGDDMAQGLGSAVQFNRLVFLVLAVALAGASVAYAGALSFLGLIAPHVARRLVRCGTTGLALVSALVGAIILVYADLLGRVAFMPRDLPAGIFVAGVGAPFFIYLLYRLRRNAGA